MKYSKQEKQFIINQLAHFYGETNPWPVLLERDWVDFTKKEMPYLEVYKKYDTMVKLVGDISPDHMILFLQDELSYYKDKYLKIMNHLDKVEDL